MIVWITHEPFPTSPGVLADAAAAGAVQVIHDTKRTEGVLDIADPPAFVPFTVTNLQFRKAIRAAGKAAPFKIYLAGLAEDAQEEWLFAPMVERNSPLVTTAASALSVANGALDNLFKAAALL